MRNGTKAGCGRHGAKVNLFRQVYRRRRECAGEKAGAVRARTAPGPARRPTLRRISLFLKNQWRLPTSPIPFLRNSDILCLKYQIERQTRVPRQRRAPGSVSAAATPTSPPRPALPPAPQNGTITTKSVPLAKIYLPFTSTKPRRIFQLRYLTSRIDSVESSSQFQSKCDDRASTCHSIPQQAGELRTRGGWQGTFPRAARANARRLWATPHADGLQLPRAGVHRNGHRENAPRLT